MARMLGAARLSHSTDGSTSIERQTEQIQHTAAARGDTLVAITEDVDVSGAVSPFERDELRPWLTDPEKIAQWDVLCVAKLDRLTRSIADFVALAEWAKANGKTLVSIGDSFDLGTPVGRMVAHILALFAQFERERMAERRADHTRKAVSQARWDGRSVAPGYRPVKVGDHLELEPDPEKKAQIEAMAAAVIAGKSARSVGQDYGLDSTGVLSILRNPGLRGYVVYHGDIVRGEDGLPVTREAILDDPTWADLQTALDRNGSPGSGRANGQASMLLDVAKCGICDAPLYIQRRPEGPRYRHRDGTDCQGSYSARILESAVESELLRLIGHVERTKTIVIPGKGGDIQAQIERVNESINQLDASFEAGDTTATTYGRMQSRLESKLAGLQATLSAMPADERDGFTREIPTGEIYREYWEGLDTEGHGKFLRDNEVKLYASRESGFAALSGAVADAMRPADIPGVVVSQHGKVSVAISFGSLSKLIGAAKAA